MSTIKAPELNDELWSGWGDKGMPRLTRCAFEDVHHTGAVVAGPTLYLLVGPS